MPTWPDRAGTCCLLLDCFGIWGRKKGRSLESHYDSVPFTYQLVFLFPPMVYIEVHDSPVFQRTKKREKGHELRKTLASPSSGREKQDVAFIV